MKYHEKQRIELHPATDQWMMGARFGSIIICNEDDGTYLIQLDKLNTPVRVRDEDIYDKDNI